MFFWLSTDDIVRNKIVIWNKIKNLKHTNVLKIITAHLFNIYILDSKIKVYILGLINVLRTNRKFLF